MSTEQSAKLLAPGQTTLAARLIAHKALAEDFADKGDFSKALVVVDDGLGLHKPNTWYHHVDSAFLAARSSEMLHYGNLCLLKAQLLKKQGELK